MPWVSTGPKHECNFPAVNSSTRSEGDLWECDVCERIWEVWVLYKTKALWLPVSNWQTWKIRRARKKVNS